ncbi:MAG: hypothetical protein V4688_00420 [Pseudomonadota bacterium]
MHLSRLTCVSALIAAALLAGCVAPRAIVRPIGSSVTVESRAVGTQEPQIRINCRATLAKDDELVKALVEERVREGNYYAALAQIQTLPADVAVVAALRADILRSLESPQAESWYRALQGCLSGRAEHGLGLIAAQRGDYTSALQKIATAAALMPADSRIRNDLGFIYLHLSMDRQAEFELRTAYELAPDDKIPGFNLALLALTRNDSEAWLYWSGRIGFDDADREELLRSCQYLMRKRSGGESSIACPLSPRASGASPALTPKALKPGKTM